MSLFLRRMTRMAAPVRRPASGLRAFSTLKEPGTAQGLDWANLGFSYQPTNSWVRHTIQRGDDHWAEAKDYEEQTVNIHIMSNALHYGQALFEGLKAFHCKDGSVRVFNSTENAHRMNSGARRLNMPEVPVDVFNEAVHRAVRNNREYVPAYGSNGALYLRPMLFGEGAQLGLGPAPEYTFAVVANPVGNYYPSGLKAVNAVVVDAYDRAAPRGVGNIKAAGNYAADVKPAGEAADAGYPIALYCDAKTNSFVEEFSTSNFIAITKDGTYVTPESDSVLPSITNKVLIQLAQDRGIKVERRAISIDELSNLQEVAACGTAVVITPIASVTRGDKKWEFGELDVLKQLYEDVRAVQVGEKEDVHGYGVVCE